jgi:hypothetical protein
MGHVFENRIIEKKDPSEIVEERLQAPDVDFGCFFPVGPVFSDESVPPHARSPLVIGRIHEWIS